MKLQIDTQLKTITIEDSIPLGELFDMLFAMFPDKKWKEYRLVPVTKIEKWLDPIVVPYTPQPVLPILPGPYTPSVPWTWPIITCETQTVTYNLDVKF